MSPRHLRQGLLPLRSRTRLDPVFDPDPGAIPAAVGTVADIPIDSGPADQVGEALAGDVDPGGLPSLADLSSREWAVCQRLAQRAPGLLVGSLVEREVSPATRPRRD